MGARTGGGPNPEKVGPKGWGPGGVGARTQKRWGPKGWWPEGVGARRGGGPKISRFFFSLPPEISFFLLSGVSSRGILVAPGN